MLTVPVATAAIANAGSPVVDLHYCRRTRPTWVICVATQSTETPCEIVYNVAVRVDHADRLRLHWVLDQRACAA